MTVLNAIEKLVDAWFALIPRPAPTRKAVADAFLIAHRGARNGKRAIFENTMPAFEQALQLGCWGIELDVHATKDQVLLVNHDPTLKRIWNQDVAIADCDFATIRVIAPMIPTLAEVVRLYGKRLHLFIELKSPFTAFEILAETLEDLEPCIDYHIISLDESIFHNVTQFPSASLLLVPVQNNTAKYVRLSLEQGYGGVSGHYALITSSKIKALKAASQIVGVGFVDSKYSLYRELNRGVRYLFTNRAERISGLLQDLAE